MAALVNVVIAVAFYVPHLESCVSIIFKSVFKKIWLAVLPHLNQKQNKQKFLYIAK